MLYSLMLYKVYSMRPELQSQNRVDVNYEKTVGLGAWLTKALWKSNISLCLSQKEKSLAPKLTEWWPFKLLLYLVKISFSFWYKKNGNEFSPSIETSMYKHVPFLYKNCHGHSIFKILFWLTWSLHFLLWALPPYSSFQARRNISGTGISPHLLTIGR